MVLFIRGYKGYHSLKYILNNHIWDISHVVTADEYGVRKDFKQDIITICEEYHIPIAEKLPDIQHFRYGLAIGWNKKIDQTKFKKLFVLHDSHLPDLKGFAPLITTLKHSIDHIGATLFVAVNEIDSGQILHRLKEPVSYPLKIEQALRKMVVLYQDLITILASRIRTNTFKFISIDDEKPSFSTWLDYEDYRIDWNKDATEVFQFINAVGFPYLGATARLENSIVRILDSELVPDITIINRTPGKVFMIEDGYPVVMCKTGLLKIKDLKDAEDNELLPCNKLKIRFT